MRAEERGREVEEKSGGGKWRREVEEGTDAEINERGNELQSLGLDISES